MIIVDKALQKLEQDGKPIRVGMIGAGFMGRGIALQLLNVVPGMDLVAISNRHLDGAVRAYNEAGVQQVETVTSVSQLEDVISKRKHAVTEDPMLLCKAQNIDVIIEVTGTIEYGTLLKSLELGDMNFEQL